MATSKMIVVAVLSSVVWMGTAAYCFANLATVPANLARIDRTQRVAPAPVPRAADQAVPVASAR